MEHSKVFPDCFHRVAVKGLCVRNGKVLLIHEGEKLGSRWEMLGGGLDFGEDIKSALKREAKEEAGLTITKISDKPVYIWTHRYEPNHRNIGWFYSLVLAYRIELEDLNLKPSEECTEVKFFSKDELRTVKLNGQTIELADIFRPEDFAGEF